MPQMINGIGTTYYGKKNVAVETHRCGKCGHIGAMESYDTRLWFVIVFIPIIPLGRKRIINYCPRCTTHRAIPLAEYQRIETESLIKLRQKAANQTNDPQATLEYSGALMDFHKNQEALDHNTEMLRRFPDRAEVQFQAGAVYERLGQREEADRCFERAYQLDPTFKPARRAKAVDLINAGRPEEAKRLLDYMFADPAERDYGLLYLLALAFTKASQPFPALDLFRLIVADRPAFAQDKKFRQAVAAAEKDANATESLLPRKKWFSASGGGSSWSPSFRLRPLLAIVAVIGILIAIAVPFAKSFHPTVHVISAYPGPLTVTIDGGNPINFAKPGRQKVKLSGGQHHARVTGPFTEDIPFDLATSFFDRFSAQPVYVINPGELGALVKIYTIYSPDVTSPSQPPPPQEVFFVGKSFFIIPNVDYPFAEFPETIKVSNNSENGTRSRLADVPASPDAVAAALIKVHQEGVCADYLESWLKVHPSSELLDIYIHCATVGKRTEQAFKLVRTKLDPEGKSIMWHRAYQNLYEQSHSDIIPLIEEYDRLLAAKPDCSQLQYLRGRIDPDSPTAISYYDRAIISDPRNFYPLMARSYHRFCQGDFGPAAKDILAAQKLAPESEEVSSLYHKILFAADENEIFAREAAAVHENIELAPGAMYFALMLDLREKDTKKASSLISQLIAIEKKENMPDDLQVHDRLQALIYYSQKDFSALAKLARTEAKDREEGHIYAAWIALEQGDAQTATAHTVKELEPDDLIPIALVMSILYVENGDSKSATIWEQKGLTPLLSATSPREAAECRDLISGTTSITQKALDNILMDPDQKKIILALMAAKFPAQRKMLLDYAHKLNYNLEFPHNFIADMK